MGCNAAVGRYETQSLLIVLYVFIGSLCLYYSTYNYAGKLNNRLLAAVHQNDIEAARLEQRRSQAVIKLLEKYGELERKTKHMHMYILLMFLVDLVVDRQFDV